MIRIDKNDFLPMERFGRAWRFTDELWNKIPTQEKTKIQPLRPEKAVELQQRSLTLPGARETDIGEYDLVCWTDASWKKGLSVRIWLWDLPTGREQEIYVSWDANDAVVTQWSVFCDYRDDFCYPGSDDVSVWPPSGEWAMFYSHHEKLRFVRPTSPRYRPY
ncbi:MAG TPA: hypothetical protein VHM16_00715 [Rubrobacteraceae bacterium]|nr:hypothetical protein [Rubrobacteraceae bacterium]